MCPHCLSYSFPGAGNGKRGGWGRGRSKTSFRECIGRRALLCVSARLLLVPTGLVLGGRGHYLIRADGKCLKGGYVIAQGPGRCGWAGRTDPVGGERAARRAEHQGALGTDIPSAVGLEPSRAGASPSGRLLRMRHPRRHPDRPHCHPDRPHRHPAASPRHLQIRRLSAMPPISSTHPSQTPADPILYSFPSKDALSASLAEFVIKVSTPCLSAALSGSGSGSDPTRTAAHTSRRKTKPSRGATSSRLPPRAAACLPCSQNT